MIEIYNDPTLGGCLLYLDHVNQRAWYVDEKTGIRTEPAIYLYDFWIAEVKCPWITLAGCINSFGGDGMW